MVAQSAEFKKAVEDSSSLTKTPTNDELLEVGTILTYATLLYIADEDTHDVDLRSLQAGQLRHQARRRPQTRRVRLQGKRPKPEEEEGLAER